MTPVEIKLMMIQGQICRYQAAVCGVMTLRSYETGFLSPGNPGIVERADPQRDRMYPVSNARRRLQPHGHVADATGPDFDRIRRCRELQSIETLGLQPVDMPFVILVDHLD